MVHDQLTLQEQVINFISQMITNISSSGVFVLDRKTATIIACNDALARIHGYDSNTDLYGHYLWNLILPMDSKSPLTALENYNYYQGEVRAFTREKNIIILDLMILYIHQFKIVLGLVQDKTKQQEEIKRLKESESRYRALVENIREGFMILDRQENILFVNSILCKSLGYNKNELLKRNISEFTYPEELKLIKDQLQTVNEELVRRIDLRMISKFNRDKSFLVSTSPLHDSKNNYTGAFVVCVDITDYSHNVCQLADTSSFLLKMLMSENEEQLLLTQGWLDILQNSVPEQQERIDKINMIVGKGIHLNNQINDLKSLERTFESPLLLIPIPEFLESINKTLKPYSSSKECLIKFKVNKEKLNLYKCPRILTLAVEQIVQNSIKRSSKNIILYIGLTSGNRIQFILTDDGRTFFETPEQPQTSKFLKDLYLTDILIRKIGGELIIKDVLPKEGLQYSWELPLNSINS